MTSRAPDALFGSRPALDILRIVEADQVGRPLVRPDPQLPAVAAQARVGRPLGGPVHVGEGRSKQPGEVAAARVAHVLVSGLLRTDEQERDVRPGTVLGSLERLDAGHGHAAARLVLPHADVELVGDVRGKLGWVALRPGPDAPALVAVPV